MADIKLDGLTVASSSGSPTVVNLDSDVASRITAKGIAKAWVNFNGSIDTGGGGLSLNENVFIRDSHNVSSVTFIGTADYEINFATNFENTNYAVTGMAGYGNNNNNLGMRVVSISSNGDFNTTIQLSKVRVATHYGNGQIESVKYCSVAIFGS